MDFARDIGYHVFGTGPCKVLALHGWFGDEGRVAMAGAHHGDDRADQVHAPYPLEHWVDGSIALLGDAAHPMMPTLAQGAAISMEDGYVLARHLDAQRNDPRAALAAYGPRLAGRLHVDQGIDGEGAVRKNLHRIDLGLDDVRRSGCELG